MVLRPEKEAEAEAIFRKWGLDFAVVGRTTDDLRFRVRHHGDRRRRPADQGTRRRGPRVRSAVGRPQRPAAAGRRARSADCAADLLRILGSPDMCSRRWVWEQYDHLILANTVAAPGRRRRRRARRTDNKGLAFTLDVTPRYCAADPFEGGKQAVAECWRNLTAVGAEPLAVTDNLNFGNPERPEIMGELVGAIKGICEACRALDFPVVSGNVSLYNETNGAAIPPTPAIGGVGLVPDVAIDRHTRLQGRRRGHLSRRRCGEPGARTSASRSGCAKSTAARTDRRRRSISPPRSAPATSSAPWFASIWSPPCTTFPTAASPSPLPRWRWLRASAPTVDAPDRADRRFLRRGSGALPRHRRASVGEVSPNARPQPASA